jgi:hypothetical protein
LALTGAGASVFFYLDNYNQSQEITNLKDTISTYESSQKESGVDKAMIQNLLDPYMLPFGAYYSVFEAGFSEDTKAIIAALNLGYQSIYHQEWNVAGVQEISFYYQQLNSEYKKLYGSDEDLPKKSLEIGKFGQFRYNETDDTFTIARGGYGGTGAFTVNKIKDFSISTDTIEVEMYHDNVPFCDLVAETAAEDEVEGKNYCVDHLDDEGIDKFLESHTEEMPVYTLKFEKDTGYERYEYKDGRFVLKSLEKTSDRVEE